MTNSSVVPISITEVDNDPDGTLMAAAPGVEELLVIARRDDSRWAGEPVAL
ncbi:hypothetical protein [Pseudomonas sp. E102]|uniref:hypothetical protein n=1 Tax=Pseudomonas sp. E102 TaxID=181579 RepID=UPI0040456318